MVNYSLIFLIFLDGDLEKSIKNISESPLILKESIQKMDSNFHFTSLDFDEKFKSQLPSEITEKTTERVLSQRNCKIFRK
jgi:hypothetical protein